MTISVCMIVKNEEQNLESCLNSLICIADEIIIVDTGSTDATKQIAEKFTTKIYDFKWTGSFSDARNFAFSKATMDYIYSADADETIDEENQRRFLKLKMALLPEVEIVQMYYCNQLMNNTIYSFDREYRPKLYKRIRSFIWTEAIHEAVQLEPVVYDSDIEIIHSASEGHGIRDLAVFEDLVEKKEPLSRRLVEIYAKELMIVGTKENFQNAMHYFEETLEKAKDEDLFIQAACICAKAYRQQNKMGEFFKYALKVVALGGCSEICYEIGEFYRETGDLEEANMWYYNAAHETHAVLAKSYEKELPEKRQQELGI